MVNHDIMEAVALPTMVNRLMEAGALRQPPPLMMINGGSCPNVPTSIKVLTKTVAIMLLP
jgi:hypothetical protein